MLVGLRALLLPHALRCRRRELLRRSAALRCFIDGLPPDRRHQLRTEALQLAGLRERIAALTGRPRCCADCATRLPGCLPGFPGGHCCGSESPPLDLDPELAVLLLAGCRPGRWIVAPVQSGCLFRAPDGCRLPPRDRPSLCLTYLCADLRAELHRQGGLAELVALVDRLEAGVQRARAELGI